MLCLRISQCLRQERLCTGGCGYPPGNVYNGVAFDDVYNKLTQAFPEAETVVADAACKTPHICRKVFDDGRVLSTAYKRPMTRKGGHASFFSVNAKALCKFVIWLWRSSMYSCTMKRRCKIVFPPCVSNRIYSRMDRIGTLAMRKHCTIFIHSISVSEYCLYFCSVLLIAGSSCSFS